MGLSTAAHDYLKVDYLKGQMQTIYRRAQIGSGDAEPKRSANAKNQDRAKKKERCRNSECGLHVERAPKSADEQT